MLMLYQYFNMYKGSHLIIKTKLFCSDDATVQNVEEAKTIDNTEENETYSIKLQERTRLLEALFELGVVLLGYYACDYMHYFARADRTYSRDVFAFCCILLLLVASAFTIQENKPGI